SSVTTSLVPPHFHSFPTRRSSDLHFPWLPANVFSAALGSCLHRKDVSCGRIKLESQDPFTGDKLTINFRRPKLPTLRGLQSQIGKILARSGRIEPRYYHLS